MRRQFSNFVPTIVVDDQGHMNIDWNDLHFATFNEADPCQPIFGHKSHASTHEACLDKALGFPAELSDGQRLRLLADYIDTHPLPHGGGGGGGAAAGT